MFVSPLEMVVLPLKKPFPVLIVNCTVAPYVGAPDPVHPDTLPLRV